MIIKKIQINDFGVYGGNNEFDFNTTSDKTVILCGGTNGAGKTTLFESIMLCFYGKDFDDSLRQKEYNEKILRLFHKNSETKKIADSASISLEFEFAFDGKIQEYQVTRTWKNNEDKLHEELSIKKLNSELNQYQELDMKVPEKTNRFTDNRFEDLDSIDKSEWQQFINQLIPKGIAKLFFFDGEKIQSIADEGNENQYLQSSFDTLLGLDIVNQLQKDISLMLYRNSKQTDSKQDDVKEDINYDESEFESILKIYGNLQLKDLSVDYLPLFLKLQKDLEKNIQNIELEIKELLGSIQDSQKQLHVIEEKFEKIGGKYFSKYREMEKNEDNLSSKIAITEKEIRDLCSTELPFSLIPEQLSEIKKQIESDQKIIRSKYEQDILEKYYSKISSLINSKSFLPEISENIKKSINFEISEIIKQENVSLNDKTFFNFSENDMVQILLLIENSRKLNIEKIYNLSNSYKIQKNALEKIELVSKITPNDDEIRPIMKEIEKITSSKTRLEEQYDELESELYQKKFMLKSMNFKIRFCINRQQESEKLSKSEKMATVVQTILDEYSNSLRSTKLSELEGNILRGLDLLLHKEDFIEKVRINHETFEVKLLNSNNDEITKNMLSKGELQIYATALVWALAQTSGRSLPFMIDTPLARLDVEHGENLIESFFPKTSQQTIILSTDSEINYDYYKKLQPSISKSYVMEFNNSKGKTEIRPGYFFDNNGEITVEVF